MLSYKILRDLREQRMQFTDEYCYIMPIWMRVENPVSIPPTAPPTDAVAPEVCQVFIPKVSPLFKTIVAEPARMSRPDNDI
jgi:hypothetical protein